MMTERFLKHEIVTWQHRVFLTVIFARIAGVSTNVGHFICL